MVVTCKEEREERVCGGGGKVVMVVSNDGRWLRSRVWSFKTWHKKKVVGVLKGCSKKGKMA